MYVPEHFLELKPDRISSLIERHAFGMLVTAPEGVPFASHLPFLLQHAGGERQTLLCHMARANPQWQHFDSGKEVLVIFHGPHAYVSPGWYASPGVPTWNYVVVHVRGKARVMEDETALESLITELTARYEANRATPWQADLSGERRAKLLNSIVGCEIEITQIQAKFKLSQNRPRQDQHRVATELRRSKDTTEAGVGTLMYEVLGLAEQDC